MLRSLHIDAAALRVSPEGVLEVPFKAKHGKVAIELGTLRVCDIIVLANARETLEAYRTLFQKAVEEEKMQ
ncbi:MAG TPA: hypothetical protein PLI09_08150 [Candidatus Hydrogenedentes bacterium]|nr:hypothetical protein [Candidatus Hydrogenedentota bacterium]